MTKSEFNQYLAERENGRYERDGWDKFVSKRKIALSCPVIHIAGSNGKGSTAHYLASIYAKAGYRVGLFIKPFFYEVNEMFSISGEQIADEELLALFEKSKKDFDKFDLSAFEIETFLGYEYFNAHKVDLAIVECGMGGGMDATNIESLQTVLSIITSISLEHTSYLGTTLSQIALSKAGIFREKTPVLLGLIDEETRNTLRDEALDLECPLTIVDDVHFNHLVGTEFHFDYGPYKDVVIDTFASYELRNASLAIEAVTLLQKSFPVSEEAVREGLHVKNLPGRAERMGRIVLDGAHNPEGVRALMAAYQTIAKGRPVHVLFASFRDKNIAVELPLLHNQATDITLTTFPHPRARSEMDYFLYIADHPYVEDPLAALKGLLAQYPDDVILITGSLAFVGHMRRLIEREKLQ